MRLVFTVTGWEDCVHWQGTDRAMVKRVNRLIDDMLRDPFTGIGKPEPLKHAFSGSWSRRITDEHRLVYVVAGDDVVIYLSGAVPLRLRGPAGRAQHRGR